MEYYPAPGQYINAAPWGTPEGARSIADAKTYRSAREAKRKARSKKEKREAAARLADRRRAALSDRLAPEDRAALDREPIVLDHLNDVAVDPGVGHTGARNALRLAAAGAP